MIELVFQVLVFMLCGIFVYELLKHLVQNLRDFRIKRECDKFEDRAFKHCLTGSLDHALEELSKKDVYSYLEELERLERQKAIET